MRVNFFNGMVFTSRTIMIHQQPGFLDCQSSRHIRDISHKCNVYLVLKVKCKEMYSTVITAVEVMLDEWGL